MNDYNNSSDSSVPLSSRFQSLSPIANTVYDVPESADLSLTELSLNDRPAPSSPKQPFSLLARPPVAPEEPPAEKEAEGDRSEVQEVQEANRRSAARTREDRLRHDLFVLQKLNSAFAVYNDALSDTQSSTEVCLSASRCIRAHEQRTAHRRATGADKCVT